MKSVKFRKIVISLAVMSVVVGMCASADAVDKKSSCGESYGKSTDGKGFFQCLYDACNGCSKKTKSKTSCKKKS